MHTVASSLSHVDTFARVCLVRITPIVDVPSWVTLRVPNQTVEMWYDELTKTFQCDEVAICELLLLAQLSDDGYVAANSIINKLFKSESDNRPITNPSVFVYTRVIAVRAVLFI